MSTEQESATGNSMVARPPSRYRAMVAHLTGWDVMGMAVGAVALLLCSFIATSRVPYFWSDELATWTMVSDPSISHMVGAIWRGTENNPPLFELLLRPWVAVAGTGSVALRLPSTVFIVGAMLVLWTSMRRVYSVAATCLGIAVVFFGAQVVLEQLPQARFYGLFMLCAALAISVTLSAALAPTVSRGALVATFLAHLALVYSHVFGGFFSGAILLSLMLSDLRARRVRPALYLSVAASWAVLAIWIPAVMAQRHMGDSRSWIQRPTRDDLFGVINRQAFLVPFAVVALSAISVRFGSVAGRSRRDTPNGAGRYLLFLIAMTFLAVVGGVFVLSRLTTPVFVDRYLIPSAMAWAVIVAEVADRSVVAPEIEGTAAQGRRRFRRLSGSAIVAAVYFVFACYPITWALARGRSEYPSVRVSPGAAGVPIVVESLHQFWPLHHYDSSSTRYRFLLDLDVASEPANSPGAVQEYKLMQLYRDEGYLARSVIDAAAFVCATPRFLVVDRPDFVWFERRISASDAYTWRTVGTYEDAPVRLVERVRPCDPERGGR